MEINIIRFLTVYNPTDPLLFSPSRVRIYFEIFAPRVGGSLVNDCDDVIGVMISRVRFVYDTTLYVIPILEEEYFTYP